MQGERYEDWRVPAVSLDMTGPGSQHQPEYDETGRTCPLCPAVAAEAAAVSQPALLPADNKILPAGLLIIKILIKISLSALACLAWAGESGGDVQREI